VSGACRRKQHRNPINSLNFMREMVKTENGKKKLCCQTSTVVCVHGTGHVYTLTFFWHGRACSRHGPCVSTARAVLVDKTSVSVFFVLFHPFMF